MHWIIQDNLYNERGMDILLEILQKYNIKYNVVKVVPFSIDSPPEEQLIPNPIIDPNELIMVCGSTTLSKIAVQRNWFPGSFINEFHDFVHWKVNYGNELLNSDSIICKFSEVIPPNEFFIRPTDDSKAFNGKVCDKEEFLEWRNRVLSVGSYTTLDADTMVSYASIKKIYTETRFFIVDKKIVGKSIYKRGNKVIYDKDVCKDTIEYCNKMIQIWCPARAFVIDIARVEIGHKIIEINCINSSGFYHINVGHFIEAIENMKF